MNIDFRNSSHQLPRQRAASSQNKNAASEWLKPDSVVIVGGSESPDSVGDSIMRNLGEYDGDVYVINHKAKTPIHGKPTYPSVDEMRADLAQRGEELPDLAVVAIPGRYVPDVITDLGENNGVNKAVVISAGFKEVENTYAVPGDNTSKPLSGPALEKDLVQKAEENGVDIIGPNCLGIIGVHTGLNLAFAGMPPAGAVALSSQSGSMYTMVMDKIPEMGMGLSQVFTMGNKAGVGEDTFLKSFAADPKTKAALLYMESVKDGRAFLDGVQEMNEAGKPVIVLKAGKTATGAAATASHTGSLAGDFKVFEQASKQAGFLIAPNTEAWLNAGLAFDNEPLPKGPNTVIITNAGGAGSLGNDTLETAGLKPGVFPKETVAALREKLLPSSGIPKDGEPCPLDILGTARAEHYRTGLEAAFADENIHNVVVMLSPQDMTEPIKTAQVIKEVAEVNRLAGNEKPVMVSYLGNNKLKAGKEKLKELGLTHIDSPEQAVEALGMMYQFTQIQNAQKAEPTPERLPQPNKAAAQAIIDGALADGRDKLTVQESMDMFKAYGLPVAGSELTQGLENTLAAAERIAGPADPETGKFTGGKKLALKISSQAMTHKKDYGGVRLFIDSPKQVRQVHGEVMEAFEDYKESHDLPKDLQMEGILVQEMAPSGLEALIGLKKDSQFGSVVVAGRGGTQVELYPDFGMRIGQIDSKEATELLDELAFSKLLDGYRGDPARDKGALAEAVARISRMGEELPQIKEMDINPAFVYEGDGGIKIVDGRFKLEAS